ncbi:MAG: hypothetical protein D6723_02695 [Acidobacteria bacterium]|nr:MAG: hypothetical protein D6723_02695 [Acidobacteriota bacterium]
MDVSDNVIGQDFRTVVPVRTEAIEEFRVTVANPNASFGRASGAQVALVTKSGSNDFHGSVYWWHQNDNLNANSWENNRVGVDRPFLIDNRFGFSVGGPIIKNRLFFFTNYEGRRFPQSSNVVRIVPTESMRRGILRFRDADGAIQEIDPTDFDPRGIGPNPDILQLMQFYPQPNDFTVGDGLNTAGFRFTAPIGRRDDYFVTRFDQNLTRDGRWTFNGVFTYQRDVRGDARQVSVMERKAVAATESRPRNLTAAVLGQITPTASNEFRFGWLHDRLNFKRTDPFPLGNFNLPINFVGFDEPIDVDAQRARSQARTINVYQFIDNFTWIRGDHTVQTGFNIRRINVRAFRNDKVIGGLTVPVALVGAGSNVSIPDDQRPDFIQPQDVRNYDRFYAALLGIVDNSSFLGVRDGNLKALPPGTGLFTNSTLWAPEFYVQDTWRLTSTLTVTAGVMYRWQTPPREKDGKQIVTVFADTVQPLDPLEYLKQKRIAAEKGEVFNPPIGFQPVNFTTAGRVFETDKNNVSPRISLAWNPSFEKGFFRKLFGEKKTVFRGGYALLYDRTNTVTTITIPTLGLGFTSIAAINGPTNPAGDPFRALVDGPIPVPSISDETAPIIPPSNLGELFHFAISPNLTVPYNHVVDFTIQRELPWDMLFEIGYIGRFARNLYQNYNLNSIPFFFADPASGQTYAQAFDAVATELRAGVDPNNVTPQPWFENLIGEGGTVMVATRRAANFIEGAQNSLWQFFLDFVAGAGPFMNQQVIDIFIRANGGRSNYNGMVVTLRKRYSHGLVFDLNYTLAKSLDQAGLIQNFAGEFSTSFFPNFDYGRSNFDLRHVFNANWVYDLPFGRGRLSTGNWVNKVIGGWWISGIFQARSGFPLQVTQTDQAFGGGLVFAVNSGAIPLRPVDSEGVNSGVKGSNGVGTSGDPSRGGSGLNLFSNPEAVANSFRPILLSQDTRHGRGVFSGLASWNLDFAIGKFTNITEDVRFGFSFEFFNMFNHVVFADPSLDLQNLSTFGVITSQRNDPRRIQFGARVEF